MANIKSLAGFLFMLFLLFLSPVSFSADSSKSIASYESVEPTKVWTVEFNTEMDSESINNETIYVIDSNENKVATSIYLTEDKRKAKVNPPANGYKQEENYQLVVTNDVYSTNKVLIKQGYSIDFTIKAADIASDNSVVFNGTVTADILNVRSGPSTNTEVLGKLKYGDEVAIYEVDGHWVQIHHDGKVGYLHKNYLKLRNVSGSILENLRIVIDAGHGDGDPGAVYGDVQEKEIVFDVSNRVGKKLEELGAVPKLTRTTDEFLELYERVKYTEENFGDIFISIHANAASSDAYGTETYYYKDKESNEKESYILAEKIQEQMVALTKMKNRGVKHGNFHVIRETEVPAVLLELGFITNDEDREKLMTDEYRELFAKAITQGIINYYMEEVE
ncbi:N-acetylmuramoyl-L-alanine amidase [Aquibacillus albus]|uniref:N-acetylmuramoyl-L-alanine amidase n=1 Tax=Aquibacillus albus TaxID=1168171 RepID=A0ABS2MWK0_9BACI|nr:N-acetylmuramoyl-L-alanine amidase [Aquibacillus albus]MBM7570257.1 N-acetylmuramoyl-L-alanine amidase [Aquibacillus albus]